ncbi:MAG: MarR family winged helix-turn-helix transcriptional regulator [Clostridiales bacterium]|nr:MarR family winged helix-turn-helix transcriptional regulator [Clostridiales bacterium]
MEPSTLRWITLLSRKTLVYLSSALAPYGLTAAEEPFYMSLYYVEGITQEELTALVYADKASTARRVKSLEAKGLLRRERDPADRRRNRLYLTEEAKARFAGVHRELLDLDQRLVGTLTPQERETLERALRTLQKTMNQVLEEQKRRGSGDCG